MKNKILSILGIFSFGFYVGALMHSRSPASFRPWDEDIRTVHLGDKIRFRAHSIDAEKFNSCEKMVLLGLQAANGNVAWVLMENCPGFPNMPEIFTNIIPQDVIEKDL